MAANPLPAARDCREPLPARREATAIEAAHTWVPGTDQAQTETLLVTFGRYGDGRVGEVFIDYPPEMKKSERVISVGDDVAVIISLALQYGAPLEVLRDAAGRADLNIMGTMRSVPNSIVGTVLDVLAAEAGLPPVAPRPNPLDEGYHHG